MSGDPQPAAQWVTRGEFAKRLEHIEERMETRFSEISSKLDAKGASARQVWIGIASILVTFLGMGAALVAFSLRAAVAPLEVHQQAADIARVELDRTLQLEIASVEKLLGASETKLQAQLDEKVPLINRSRDDATELRARLDILQQLVFRDVVIDHGGGGDGNLTAARLEQTMGRQGELLDSIEVLRLQINKLSERLVALEGQP